MIYAISPWPHTRIVDYTSPNTLTPSANYWGPLGYALKSETLSSALEKWRPGCADQQRSDLSSEPHRAGIQTFQDM